MTWYKVTISSLMGVRVMDTTSKSRNLPLGFYNCNPTVSDVSCTYVFVYINHKLAYLLFFYGNSLIYIYIFSIYMGVSGVFIITTSNRSCKGFITFITISILKRDEKLITKQT